MIETSFARPEFEPRVKGENDFAGPFFADGEKPVHAPRERDPRSGLCGPRTHYNPIGAPQLRLTSGNFLSSGQSEKFVTLQLTYCPQPPLTTCARNGKIFTLM